MEKSNAVRLISLLAVVCQLAQPIAWQQTLLASHRISLSRFCLDLLTMYEKQHKIGKNTDCRQTTRLEYVPGVHYIYHTTPTYPFAETPHYKTLSTFNTGTSVANYFQSKVAKACWKRRQTSLNCVIYILIAYLRSICAATRSSQIRWRAQQQPTSSHFCLHCAEAWVSLAPYQYTQIEPFL